MIRSYIFRIRNWFEAGLVTSLVFGQLFIIPAFVIFFVPFVFKVIVAAVLYSCAGYFGGYKLVEYNSQLYERFLDSALPSSFETVFIGDTRGNIVISREGSKGNSRIERRNFEKFYFLSKWAHTTIYLIVGITITVLLAVFNFMGRGDFFADSDKLTFLNFLLNYGGPILAITICNCILSWNLARVLRSR